MLHNFRHLALADQPSAVANADLVKDLTLFQHCSKIAGTENNIVTPYIDYRQASLGYAILHVSAVSDLQYAFLKCLIVTSLGNVCNVERKSIRPLVT